MTKHCEVAGCGLKTAGYSRHCSNHRARARRQGHPLQQSVTAPQVRRYVQLMRTWVATQANEGELLAAFDAAAVALVESVAPVAATTLRAGERRAIQELLKVHEDVGPRKIVETVAAMAIIWEREPHLFRSDRAYWVQVARRVRALTDRNAGSYWNEKQKRTIKIYRDGSSAALECLGRMLTEALGGIGLRIGKYEAAQAERRDVGRAKAAAIAALETSAPLITG